MNPPFLKLRDAGRRLVLAEFRRRETVIEIWPNSRHLVSGNGRTFCGLPLATLRCRERRPWEVIDSNKCTRCQLVLLHELALAENEAREEKKTLPGNRRGKARTCHRVNAPTLSDSPDLKRAR